MKSEAILDGVKVQKNKKMNNSLFETTKMDKRRLVETIAFWSLRVVALVVLFVVCSILYFICANGISAISWEFITEMPKSGMTAGGIYPAIIGTGYLVFFSMLFSLPVGVFAGIYLQEYATEGVVTKIIRVATNNLAGVPSVVFGLFGMMLFVNYLGFGASILAGSLTLALVVLPVIIRTTEEAIKTVPNEWREGSLALGATKWQTIYKVILPASFSGIMTGSILSVGRVAGETAPILFTCAAYFLPRLPESVFDEVMALPYHLYVISTSGTQIEKTRPLAYGTALVLLVIVVITNLIAVYLRNKFKIKQ